MSAPNLEMIPSELKAPEVRRWVIWKLTEGKDKDGKQVWKKLPYQAKNGYLAKANDPKTWCSFDEAVRAYTDKITIIYTEKGKVPVKLQGGPDGLGFELGFEESTGKTYFGVDLDGLTTPEKWKWATEIIKALDTYSEISPSGKGVHILGIGMKGPGQTGTNCRKKGVEVYDKRHYFTMTGNHFEGSPLTLNDREEELRAFHASTWGNPSESHKGEKGKRDDGGSPLIEPPPLLVALTDEEIKQKLLNETGAAGDKARDLFVYGFYQKHFPDDSEDGGDWSGADQSLMNKIEFYCVNPSDEENARQLDRIFSDSKLAKLDASSGRDKWTPGDLNSNPYRQATISKAIAFGKKPDADHWSPHSKSDKGKGKKKGKSLAARVVDAILENYILRIVKETGTILVKEPSGGWREMEELELGAIAQRFGGRDQTTPSVLKDVYSKIEHERKNIISLKDFERRPDLLMDANGTVFSSLSREVVDITGDEFKDVFVIHKIGAIFDPSAPVPPEYLKVEEEIIPNKQERLTFQEHIGTGFLRTMELDKIFCIVGDTRNGKTTLFEIVLKVAGKENVSTISLKQMGMPYHTFKMWRMLFNIMDDISNESLRNTEFFKAWLGGFPVNIMKKYGMPVDTNLYCKGLCGANLLAASANKNDQGYYSKWILASAPNSFKLENELTNEERETGVLGPNCYHADPELVKKLTSDPRKLSGILNHFLEGLARVKRNGNHYTLRMTLEENRVRYDSMATPLNEVTEFMNMITQREDMSKETRKADVFKLLGIYLQARKIPPVSMNVFNDALKEIGIGHKDRSSKAKDIPPLVALEDAGAVYPAVLRGVSLKKGWEEMLSTWRTLIEIDGKTELLED